MIVVEQEGVDDLPFVHAGPAYRRRPSGLEVPCDGPRLLALDDAGTPICSACSTRVVPK